MSKQYRIEFYELLSDNSLRRIEGQRETCLEENRSYPGWICSEGDKVFKHYKDETIDDLIKVTCLEQHDPRLAEVPMLLVEKIYDDGLITTEWFSPEKYVEGKKCKSASLFARYFTFGKVLGTGTALDAIRDGLLSGGAATCIV